MTYWGHAHWRTRVTGVALEGRIDLDCDVESVQRSFICEERWRRGSGVVISPALMWERGSMCERETYGQQTDGVDSQGVEI